MRPKLTYSNVISTVCLFLLLGGGAAYAASSLGKNSVGTKQLKNNAVTGSKVKNGSLLAQDFKSGQLPAGAQGPPASTNVVTRYGDQRAVETLRENVSYAVCHTGEAVTGGGYEFIEKHLPANSNYLIAADRPSIEAEELHPAPPDGTKPSGWLVVMRNGTGSTFEFRSYVMCASP
jgi:hypothetical protein